VPERRSDDGFTLLGSVGGSRQIRFAQWYTEMGAVFVLGGLWVLILQVNKKSDK
jgi:hypothetical protein